MDKVDGTSRESDLGGFEHEDNPTPQRDPGSRPKPRRLSSRNFTEPPDVKSLLNNSVCGTFLHMAPEVVTSETYDEKVDVFSLGMVMFQIFSYTSMVTFLHQSGFTIKDGQAAIVRGWRPPLHFCGPLPISSLIERCWSCDPELRPTAQEVVDELMAYLSEDPDDKLKAHGVLKRFARSVKSLARSAKGHPPPLRLRRFSVDGRSPATSTFFDRPFLSLRRFSSASSSGTADLSAQRVRSARASGDNAARTGSNESVSKETKAMWDQVAQTMPPTDTTPKVAKPLRKQHEQELTELSESTSYENTSDFGRYAI